MILGVNGIRLLGKRSGVGRTIENVLHGFGRVGHPFEKIHVYTPEPLPEGDNFPPEVVNVTIPSRLPPGLWEQWTLPRAHGRQGPLFCPSYVVPLFAPCPTYLVHQGSYEGYSGVRQAYSWWTRTRSHTIYRLSARRATHVSTVSESSRRDMVRFYGLQEKAIRVIYNGVDLRTFRPEADPADRQAWRTRLLGVDAPYLLYVGKPTRRRNPDALLEAFKQIKQTTDLPHKLLLIGTAQEGADVRRMIRTLGLADAVVTIPFAEPETVAGAYQACDLFIYPSSYEGFGMPVVEALACGAPVLALNNTAIPEISGGIAHLLPNAEIPTLVEGIRFGLTDQAFREKAAAEGPRQAKKFDWEIITRQYVDFLTG